MAGGGGFILGSIYMRAQSSTTQDGACGPGQMKESHSEKYRVDIPLPDLLSRSHPTPWLLTVHLEHTLGTALGQQWMNLLWMNDILDQSQSWSQSISISISIPIKINLNLKLIKTSINLKIQISFSISVNTISKSQSHYRSQVISINLNPYQSKKESPCD